MRPLALFACLAACGGGGSGVDAPPATVTVTVRWPGHAAADAARALAAPIENLLAADRATAHVASASDDDGTTVIALLDRGADGVTLVQRIEDGLTAIARALPSDAEPPTVERRVRSRGRRILLRSQELTAGQLRTVADWRVRPALLAIAGVRAVDVCGGALPRVEVRVDPARLAARGLDVSAVIEALRAGGAEVPAGALEVDGDTVVVRALGERDLEGLRHATVDGVSLSEIADVIESPTPDPCPAPDGAVAIDVWSEDDVDVDAVLRDRPAGVVAEVVRTPARYAVALTDDDPTWRAALATAPGVQVIDDATAPVATWSLDDDAIAAHHLDPDAVALDLQALDRGVEVGEVRDPARSPPMPLVVRLIGDPSTVQVHGVPLVTLARRATGPREVDAFDRRPTTLVRFIVDGDEPDAIARRAIDRAHAIAPVPALLWREP